MVRTVRQDELDPEARARNGSRFAASYHRWTSRLAEPPPVLPREWAPLPLNELPDHIGPRPGATPRSEPRNDFRCRRNVVATLSDVPGARHVRKALVFPEERQAYGKKDSQYHQACKYCAVSDYMDRVTPHTTTEPKVLVHPNIVPSFDASTFVSAATVDNFRVELTTQEMCTLFSRVDPRHWVTTAPDFFQLSQPGKWRNSNWDPVDDPEEWVRTERGQI